MKIVLLESLSVSKECMKKYTDILEQEGHSFQCYERNDDPEVQIQEIGDADIVMIANMPLSGKVISACPNLKFIDVAFTDPVVSVQILFRNLYRINQIHLICRRDCVQQLLRIPMMSGCVHNCCFHDLSPAFLLTLCFFIILPDRPEINGRFCTPSACLFPMHSVK